MPSYSRTSEQSSATPNPHLKNLDRTSCELGQLLRELPPNLNVPLAQRDNVLLLAAAAKSHARIGKGTVLSGIEALGNLMEGCFESGGPSAVETGANIGSLIQHLAVEAQFYQDVQDRLSHEMEEQRPLTNTASVGNEALVSTSTAPVDAMRSVAASDEAQCRMGATPCTTHFQTLHVAYAEALDNASFGREAIEQLRAIFKTVVELAKHDDVVLGLAKLGVEMADSRHNTLALACTNAIQEIDKLIGVRHGNCLDLDKKTPQSTSNQLEKMGGAE